MDNGSEYRTLLKAFGIRFDVLVYGDVSSGPGAGRDQGPFRARRRGRVLRLTRPATLAGHISAAGWGGGRPLVPREPSGSTAALAGSPSLASGLTRRCRAPCALTLVFVHQAGKFNIIPTIISSVAAFTSVGVVSAALQARSRPGRGVGGKQASLEKEGDALCCLEPSPPRWASISCPDPHVASVPPVTKSEFPITVKVAGFGVVGGDPRVPRPESRAGAEPAPRSREQCPRPARPPHSLGFSRRISGWAHPPELWRWVPETEQSPRAFS